MFVIREKVVCSRIVIEEDELPLFHRDKRRRSLRFHHLENKPLWLKLTNPRVVTIR
jgi:hypothetical protein